MFRRKSGWFSNSVPQACQDFWIVQGGTAAGWRTADYLFSADATSPDTLRIYESTDYLWNNVTVFHSLFLSACENRQSVTSVCVGHYVLPPASVQDEVRNMVGRFIWECEDKQSAQGSHTSFHTEDGNTGEGFCNPEPSDADSSETHHTQDYPVSNMLTGYVGMDNLKKYTGDLCDFHPVCFRCSSSQACT